MDDKFNISKSVKMRIDSIRETLSKILTAVESKKELNDLVDRIEAQTKAINGKDMSVTVDVTELKDSIDSLCKVVTANKSVPVDMSKIESLLADLKLANSTANLEEKLKVDLPEKLYNAISSIKVGGGPSVISLNNGDTGERIAPATSTHQEALQEQIKHLETFQIDPYDYIALTYVASGNGLGEVETVTYKTGGANGTTVGILTLMYNGSNEISSVTKS